MRYLDDASLMNLKFVAEKILKSDKLKMETFTESELKTSLINAIKQVNGVS